MDDKFTRRFIVGVSSTSIGTVCQIVSSFLCLMITARVISKEQFGYYVIMLVIASMYGMLSSLFLDFVAITKLISSADDQDKPKVVNAAISYKISIDLSICLLILASKPLVGYFISFAGLPWWPVYVAVLFFLSNANLLFVRILQGLHQYKAIALSQAVNGVIRIITILLFLSYYKMDIKGVIYATVISCLVTSAYQFVAIPLKKKIEFDRDTLKKMFRFGFPLGLNNVMSFVFMKVDRFMLGSMLSPIQVAYYEIASKLPECGRTLYEAYQTVFFPSMSELCARRDHADAGNMLNNSIRIFSFVSLLATFIMYLFQNEIVGALFSKRYLPSAPALPLLMMVLCLDITGNMLGTTLVAYGQSDKPVKINVFAAVTTVVSNLVLIPWLGFIGAAYTCILSRVIANPINVWYLNKQGLRVDVSQYLKPLCAFFICYCLTLLLKPESIWLKLAYIVVFLATNVLMSVISSEDIVLVKKNILRQAGC